MYVCFITFYEAIVILLQQFQFYFAVSFLNFKKDFFLTSYAKFLNFMYIIGYVNALNYQ